MEMSTIAVYGFVICFPPYFFFPRHFLTFVWETVPFLLARACAIFFCSGKHNDKKMQANNPSLPHMSHDQGCLWRIIPDVLVWRDVIHAHLLFVLKCPPHAGNCYRRTYLMRRNFLMIFCFNVPSKTFSDWLWFLENILLFHNKRPFQYANQHAFPRSTKRLFTMHISWSITAYLWFSNPCSTSAKQDWTKGKVFE